MHIDQPAIDHMSDVLKKIALGHIKISETPICAWFVNEPDGPQFFIGDIRTRKGLVLQPLYNSKATEMQDPVAWISRKNGVIITQNKSCYRDDIVWEPLYTAR